MDEMIKDLEKILDYLEPDELKHYQENPDGTHIFRTIIKLRKWINSVKPMLVSSIEVAIPITHIKRITND